MVYASVIAAALALDGVKDLLSPLPPDDENDLPPSWLDIRVGGDRRSRRGLTQAALMLSLPLIIIFLMAMQGVFNVALVPQLLLGKAFFILLTFRSCGLHMRWSRLNKR